MKRNFILLGLIAALTLLGSCDDGEDPPVPISESRLDIKDW